MTKKDYIKIAKTIQGMTLVNCPTQADLDAANYHRDNAASRFASMLAADSASFDRARFLAACK